MKQQSLFKQTVLDLINEKPLDKKAFRQGHNWAECKRRSNMTVRKTISQVQSSLRSKGCGRDRVGSVIAKGI